MPTEYPQKLVCYVSLPVGGDAEQEQLNSLLTESEWNLDVDATRQAPSPLQVVRREMELDESSPTAVMQQVYSDLAEHEIGTNQMQYLVQPSSNEIAVLIKAILGDGEGEGNGEKEGDGDGEATKPEDSVNGSGKGKEKEAEKPVVEAAPAGGNGTDATAAITAAAAALADPVPLWKYVGGTEKSELAKATISSLYSNRTDLGRKAEWVVAPEMVLLESCPEDDREGLAKHMLEVRAELTEASSTKREAEAALVHQKADLAAQEVELAKQRVELAAQGVALVGESYQHMKTWRKLAKTGQIVLVLTTAFAIGCVWEVLESTPDDEITGAGAAALIFVLALFAISPAVLLLLGRPLKGLDEWMPAGGAAKALGEDGKEPTTKDPGAKESGSGAAADAGEAKKS